MFADSPIDVRNLLSEMADADTIADQAAFAAVLGYVLPWQPDSVVEACADKATKLVYSVLHRANTFDTQLRLSGAVMVRSHSYTVHVLLGSTDSAWPCCMPHKPCLWETILYGTRSHASCVPPGMQHWYAQTDACLPSTRCCGSACQLVQSISSATGLLCMQCMMLSPELAPRISREAVAHAQHIAAVLASCFQQVRLGCTSVSLAQLCNDTSNAFWLSCGYFLRLA